MTLRCKVLGHDIRFWAEDETMRWDCERDCGFSGSKEYPDTATAAKMATAFDRVDRDNLGKRAPLSLTPLRLVRRGR